MITPTEAMALRKGDAQKIEQYLDEAIKSHFSKGTTALTIAISLLSSDSNTLESVLEKYRALGWKINRVADWRDGDYVELKA